MTEHRINESADKIVLKAEVKRGTGTRDQDKIKMNSETINRQLRDAQIALQKAKNARRQALIFDRVYDKVEQDKLQVDEYEVEVDNALE